MKADANRILIFELGDALLRSWWTLVAGICVGAAVGLLAIHFLPKQYEAATTILVTPQQIPEEFVETTVTNSAEVKQAAQSIIDKVDAIYVSTDNTVVSALSSITDVAMKAKVPIMSADPSSAEQFDILAAYGFDYYGMGKATGKLIAEVLKGKPTSKIPTRYMTDAKDLILHLNLDVAKEIGLSIPDSLVKKAGVIVENGEVQKM